MQRLDCSIETRLIPPPPHLPCAPQLQQDRRDAELRAKREEEEQRKRREEKRRQQEEQKRREEEELFRRKQVGKSHLFPPFVLKLKKTNDANNANLPWLP